MSNRPGLAAGQRLNIARPVSEDLIVAGEQVNLSAGASTYRWAWLAKHVLQVLGDIGGALKTAAQEVVIGGIVGGVVTAYA